MSDTPSTASSTTPQTSVEFMLPISGEKFTVNKLKAGKYYEAQKIYTAWLNDILLLANSGNVDVNAFKDDLGNIDFQKVSEAEKEATNSKLTLILDKNQKCAENKMNLIAICTSIPVEKLQEEYYPEDLEKIFENCSSINNFIDNLKKSVAPTVGIGV